MKQIFLSLYIILFTVSAVAQDLGRENDFDEKKGIPTNFVPNRVIVKFNSAYPKNKSAKFQSSLAKKLKVTKTKKIGFVDAEIWDLANQDVLEVIKNWKHDSRIKYIEPDYYVYPSAVPNDPSLGTQWGLAKIQAIEAWDINTGGDVIVAVMDSGVDTDHEDLVANLWVNPGEIPDNNIDDDNNGYIDDVHGYDFLDQDGDPEDDTGHGTRCAGIIAAAGNNGNGITGVTWNAKIMAVRIFGSNGSTSDLVLAYEYATMMGARLTNNSYVTSFYSQMMYDAVEAAGNAGVLFIAGTNNGSGNSGVWYPAFFNLDNIISVTSTNEIDSLAGRYHATSVDLGAPGTNILSTGLSNNYGSSSGTSFATPHVTGTAALLWSFNPSLTISEVKAAILNSVDPISSLAGKTVTGGRLNAFKAISALIKNTTFISPGTWDNGDPSTVTNAILDFNYNTSLYGASINTLNMVINTGITLTIDNGSSVNVKNEFNVNGLINVMQGGTLTIQDPDE